MTFRDTGWDFNRTDPRPAREQFRLEAGYAEQAAEDLDQEQPLPAIHEIKRAIQQLENMQAYAVQVARTQGKSWEEIAGQLGMTRQGAHQKFGQSSATR